MAFDSGSYGAVQIAMSIPAGSVGTFNHALGATPLVILTGTGQQTAQGSAGYAPPIIVSRTTSYIGLLNVGLTVWIGDVYCNRIHSIFQ